LRINSSAVSSAQTVKAKVKSSREGIEAVIYR
jgi:hypothetical protein